jgi:hypothetical protein
MLSDKEEKQLNKFCDELQSKIEYVGEMKIAQVQNTDLVLAIVAKWILNHDKQHMTV